MTGTDRPREQGRRRSISRLIPRDLAVDLGTANTLVYVRGEGIVLDEPSVVAVRDDTGDVVAVGTAAKRMLGRTPDGISVVRPLAEGVIADFDACEQMLRYFVQQVTRRSLLRFVSRPRVVVCVPAGITSVEHRAVRDAGYAAGARSVAIIEEPMAAALGAGLPVHEAVANLVVDIGGGTTEVAVISLGGVVTGTSTRVAGDAMDEAVIRYVRATFGLLLGERTAERLKLEIGSAFPWKDEPSAEVRGRDQVTGLPQTIVVPAAEVRRALDEPVRQIVDAVRVTLDKCPPELAADVMDAGIVLTGGGALLRGLDERIAHETGVTVRVADDPLGSVARGAGMCLEEFDLLHRVLIPERGRR
jgi:rod shape-determining protein MreB